VFCDHDTVAEPDPLPLDGITESHDPFPDADQFPPLQPDGEPVIVTPVEFAPWPAFVEFGLIEKPVHVGGTETTVAWMLTSSTRKMVGLKLVPPVTEPSVWPTKWRTIVCPGEAAENRL